MRAAHIALLLVGLAPAAWAQDEDKSVPAAPGAACPPGTTEVRPGRCMAPSAPPPSILDYRPRATLVVPRHMKPAAKYPAIDWHGHPDELLESAAGLASMGASLDSLNVRLIVVANNISGDELVRDIALVNASPKMKDRVRFLAGIDFNGVGPGWSAKAIAQLERDVAAGAVGVGEISKRLGLSIKKADGSRLRIDDPELDPIWDACARLNLPVFIHTADPAQFFQPVDYTNERWLELSLFPGRRYPPDRYPTFEELMLERDCALPAASQDDLRRGASRLAGQRPRAARQAAR